MSLKPFEAALAPDPRFADLCVVEEGVARRMTFRDHHAEIVDVGLKGAAPAEVKKAFDRARSVMIYAFFDYDLFVVGEVQALGAFELALKFHLNGHGRAARGTLRNLVDRARKAACYPHCGSVTPTADPIEALVALRNGLSHGSADIHVPGMALKILAACADWIDFLFPKSSD
ncbi:hypothetical protein [Ensifer aridi]|uniref:hypothetical protein n=1 Tax=Ensifer aridi TaxID=1708715 RepID=UPI000A1210A0|nr:hypothetical protein [Ensifer aridi]